jgi:hypothetical protein
VNGSEEEAKFVEEEVAEKNTLSLGRLKQVTLIYPNTQVDHCFNFTAVLL